MARLERKLNRRGVKTVRERNRHEKHQILLESDTRKLENPKVVQKSASFAESIKGSITTKKDKEKPLHNFLRRRTVALFPTPRAFHIREVIMVTKRG